MHENERFELLQEPATAAMNYSAMNYSAADLFFDDRKRRIDYVLAYVVDEEDEDKVWSLHF